MLFRSIIYENQGELQPEALIGWAAQIGLDIEKFESAIRKGELTKRIKDDRMSGISSGVNGTPCFFINGERYDGAADLESLLSALSQ